MFLMGKTLVAAERRGKLARHKVSGQTHQIGFVPEGQWIYNVCLRPIPTSFQDGIPFRPRTRDFVPG
jgi:hypothetical protein